MATDRTVEDFETEGKAKVLFDEKKKKLKNAKTVDGLVPSSHIHKCYHDEAPPGGTPPRPCEPPLYKWEKT